MDKKQKYNNTKDRINFFLWYIIFIALLFAGSYLLELLVWLHPLATDPRLKKKIYIVKKELDFNYKVCLNKTKIRN